MISAKQIYCNDRAAYLHENLGLTLKQGYEQAEREWNRTHKVSSLPDYDDDVSDLEDYVE